MQGCAWITRAFLSSELPYSKILIAHSVSLSLSLSLKRIAETPFVPRQTTDWLLMKMLNSTSPRIGPTEYSTSDWFPAGLCARGHNALNLWSGQVPVQLNVHLSGTSPVCQWGSTGQQHPLLSSFWRRKKGNRHTRTTYLNLVFFQTWRVTEDFNSEFTFRCRQFSLLGLSHPINSFFTEIKYFPL